MHIENVFILSTYFTDSLNRRRDLHLISFSLIILKAWLHCLLASSGAFEEFDETGIFYLCVTLLLAGKILGLAFIFLFWNFTIMDHRLFFFFLISLTMWAFCFWNFCWFNALHSKNITFLFYYFYLDFPSAFCRISSVIYSKSSIEFLSYCFSCHSFW